MIVNRFIGGSHFNSLLRRWYTAESTFLPATQCTSRPKTWLRKSRPRILGLRVRSIFLYAILLYIYIKLRVFSCQQGNTLHYLNCWIIVESIISYDSPGSSLFALCLRYAFKWMGNWNLLKLLSGTNLCKFILKNKLQYFSPSWFSNKRKQK